MAMTSNERYAAIQDAQERARAVAAQFSAKPRYHPVGVALVGFFGSGLVVGAVLGALGIPLEKHTLGVNVIMLLCGVVPGLVTWAGLAAYKRTYWKAFLEYLPEEIRSTYTKA